MTQGQTNEGSTAAKELTKYLPNDTVAVSVLTLVSCVFSTGAHKQITKQISGPGPAQKKKKREQDAFTTLSRLFLLSKKGKA